jgi:hypothetical protein
VSNSKDEEYINRLRTKKAKGQNTRTEQSAQAAGQKLSEFQETLAQTMANAQIEIVGARAQQLMFEKLAQGDFGIRAEHMRMSFLQAYEEYSQQQLNDLEAWESSPLFLPQSQNLLPDVEN